MRTLTVFLSLFSFVLTASTAGLCSEVKLIREIQVPEGPFATPSGTARGRSIVLSRTIPSETGSPVLVYARGNTILYIDTGDLNVIRETSFPALASPILSPDGRYIALNTRAEWRDTSIPMLRLGVEDWMGRPLWALHGTHAGRREPTVSGGMIVYPACRQWSYWERSTLHPRFHGLMVYSPEGTLRLHLLNCEEMGSSLRGVFSPEGRYLAVRYQWLSRPGGGDGITLSADSICVVLVDVEVGVEVWHRCFDAYGCVGLAVGSEGDRVLCMTLSGESMKDVDVDLRLLNRDGNEIAIDQESSYEVSAPVHGPLTSPSGQFCAFTVGDARMLMMRMEDGSIVWELDLASVEGYPGLEGRPLDTWMIRCLHLTGGGLALLEARERGRPGINAEKRLWVLDGHGDIIHDIDACRIGSGRHIASGWISEDGQSLWLVQGSTLSLYSIQAEAEH